MRVLLLLFFAAWAAGEDNDVAKASKLTVAMPSVVVNIVLLNEPFDMREFSKELTVAMEDHLNTTLPETLAPSNVYHKSDFRHVTLIADLQKTPLIGIQDSVVEQDVEPTFNGESEPLTEAENKLCLVQASVRGYADFVFEQQTDLRYASERTKQVAIAVELASMESLEGEGYDGFMELITAYPLLAVAIKVQISVGEQLLNEGNVPDLQDAKGGSAMKLMFALGGLFIAVMLLWYLAKGIRARREKRKKAAKKSWKRSKSSDHSSSHGSSYSGRDSHDEWMDHRAKQLATVQTRSVEAPARRSKRLLKMRQQQQQQQPQQPPDLYAIREEDSMNSSSNWDSTRELYRDGSYRDQQTFLNEFSNAERSQQSYGGGYFTQEMNDSDYNEMESYRRSPSRTGKAGLGTVVDDLPQQEVSLSGSAMFGNHSSMSLESSYSSSSHSSRLGGSLLPSGITPHAQPAAAAEMKRQVHFRAYDSYRENSFRGMEDSYSSRTSMVLSNNNNNNNNNSDSSSLSLSQQKQSRQNTGYVDYVDGDDSIQIFASEDLESSYAISYAEQLAAPDEESLQFSDIDLSGRRNFKASLV